MLHINPVTQTHIFVRK